VPPVRWMALKLLHLALQLMAMEDGSNAVA
jgi:hypothetical protein